MRSDILFSAMLACANVFAASSFAQTTDDQGWKKVSDENGMSVFIKNIDSSDVISLRGEAIIPAPVAEVVDVLKDNKAASDWMPMVVERRDLKYLSEWERIEFTHLRLPWPLADRYFVNLGKAEPLPEGGMRLFVKSVDFPEFKEHHEDKVKGHLHYSEFLLTPVEGGRKTQLRLEINSDPKGMIPKWLANRAQLDWPKQFFSGLLRQLDKKPLAH